MWHTQLVVACDHDCGERWHDGDGGCDVLVVAQWLRLDYLAKPTVVSVQ